MTTTGTTEMEERTTPVISGIVVLVAGLLAFFAVITGVSGDAEAGVTDTRAAASTSYSGLDPVLERVLLGSGDAWVYRPGAGGGLPDELTRVLAAYQAPLIIPAGEAP